jgi:superfamily I DNA and RNA helicase
MEEIRNGFNNIMSAFASQAGGGPEAGVGKILTVSLTDENANNISTMIVNKMNEEKAADPAEVDKKGVSHDDLGIEIRDSKRSIISEIDSVRSAIEALIKEIEKKAMTFDQIYKKLCVTMIRDHKRMTGRNIG